MDRQHVWDLVGLAAGAVLVLAVIWVTRAALAPTPLESCIDTHATGWTDSGGALWRECLESIGGRS